MAELLLDDRRSLSIHKTEPPRTNKATGTGRACEFLSYKPTEKSSNIEEYYGYKTIEAKVN